MVFFGGKPRLGRNCGSQDETVADFAALVARHVSRLGSAEWQHQFRLRYFLVEDSK